MRFFIPILSRYGAILIQFLLVALITQRLSLDEAGVYFLLFGAVLTSYFMAGFGLPDGCVKAFPAWQENHPREAAPLALRATLVIGWSSSLGLACLFAAGSFLWLGAELPTGSGAIALWAGLWWLAYGCIFVSAQVLIAAGQIKTGAFAFYAAINFAALFLVVPLLFLISHPSLEFVIAAMAGTSALASLGIALWTWGHCPATGPWRACPSLRQAWKTGAAIAIGRVLQAALIWTPVWIAGGLLGETAAAQMGLGLRLVSAVGAVLATIRFSIRPELARHVVADRWPQIRALCGDIAFWVSLLAIGALIASLVLGPWLIPLIFGAGYQDVWLLVALLLLGVFGESMAGPIDEVLKMSGAAARVSWAQALALGLGCLLQLAGAAAFGLAGIALGYGLTFMALYAGLIGWLRACRGVVIFAHPPQDWGGKYGRWVRYLRHVPPARIWGKLRHERLVKAVIAAPEAWINPAPLPPQPFAGPALLGFATAYKALGARFYENTRLAEGVFVSKGVAYDFGSISQMHWDNPFAQDNSRIHWGHDLAFFSFTLPLAQSNPTAALALIDRLVAQLEARHPIGAGGQLHFVWQPIALALRVMGLSSAMALIRAQNKPLDHAPLARVGQHVARASALLELTSERYLGYNHHVFGETALYVAALAAGQPAERPLKAALKALEAHVLPDGFWAERSPSYHIHMLMLARGLQATAPTDASVMARLQALIARMTQALAAVVHPDGEIAIFNDAAIDDAVPPAAVGYIGPPPAMVFLPQTGFARLEQAGSTVIFDAGPMGPQDVIGHGHGDFLSVEISIGGIRLFVDPGVASIAADTARQWTRSAQSHNGPTLEGLEPAEFFGAWRVGRRGRAWFKAAPSQDANGTLCLTGCTDGYAREAGLVERQVELAQDGRVRLRDYWHNPSAAAPQSRFILAAGWRILSASPHQLRLRAANGTRVELRLLAGEILNSEILNNAILRGEVVARETLEGEMRDREILAREIGGAASVCLYFPLGPMLPHHGHLLVLRPTLERLLRLEITCL